MKLWHITHCNTQWLDLVTWLCLRGGRTALVSRYGKQEPSLFSRQPMQRHRHKTYMDSLGLWGYLAMFTLPHWLYLLAIMTLEALSFPMCSEVHWRLTTLNNTSYVSNVCVDHEPSHCQAMWAEVVAAHPAEKVKSNTERWLNKICRCVWA